MITKSQTPPPAPSTAALRDGRLHPRVPLRLSAEVMCERDVFTACTNDCSLGGVRLEVDRPLNEGAAIALVLFLVIDDIEDESAQPISIRGHVIWCTEAEGVTSDGHAQYQAGVRFTNPPAIDGTWLAAILTSSPA